MISLSYGVLLLLALCTGCWCQITLYSLFNNAGVQGNITFYQGHHDTNVTISIHLTSLTPEPRSFAWGIYSFPVFFDTKSPCASSELGTTFHDLSKRHGSITIPSPDGMIEKFTDADIQLRGQNTIWGRALLLRNAAYNVDVRACANIMSEGDVKTVEATFTSPVAGTVIFRQGELGETTIFANVFHTTEDYSPSSNHEWRILATDILERSGDITRRGERRCEYLQILFDPNNIDDTECSPYDHQRCKIGDMTRKHKEAVVGATNSRYSKRFYVDTNLPLAAVEGLRTLYLVLYEKGNPFRVMACAKLNSVKPKEVRAYFNSDDLKGHILLSQSYRTQPTVVTVQIKNLRGRGTTYHIHEFPVPEHTSAKDHLCSVYALGDLYNPFELDPDSSPPPGKGTGDQYPVGDLSGKFGRLDSSPLLNLHLGIHVDFNLPLFGTYSVIGRSIAIADRDGGHWVCANIGYPGPTRMAIATFVYPVIGQFIFRQLEDSPWSETTVFGSLNYADGSINNTEGHRWDVHENEPGRDFYNWTKRCESAGAQYNPHGVGAGRQYERYCNPLNPLRCSAGDLTGKYKRLSIAAKKGNGVKNKIFYTDVHLPLSGPSKILGKGLVIHDDHAPPHRGDILACTGIRIRHPLKASVKYWFSGPAVESNVSGVIQFQQESAFDITDVKVDFSGLAQIASGYHVHEVWVPIDREFPCTADSVYQHFNPFGVNVSLGPSPGVGSNDQYEVGDLSGKHGTLDDEDGRRATYLDNNLPLHGIHSIIGRSVVIHKRVRNFRWTCGTIRADYKSENTREVIGIASFHRPGSFVIGYIRLRQLEYADGGRGDTWIEVDLRYAGKQNRNVPDALPDATPNLEDQVLFFVWTLPFNLSDMGDPDSSKTTAGIALQVIGSHKPPHHDKTTGHEWAVYVNQVAHDAVEKVETSRCIASGYRWNPYIVKSDDEFYKTECNVANPFRCEMGDLSGRHGTLEIGTSRRVFTDVNLPLVGNYSVMGRSIVIFGKNGLPTKLACANIKPDIHLIRHVTVKKHPGFTVLGFMTHMREVLDTHDWLVMQDAQSQRDILDGQCVQITVHFYGPDAHRLQIEFSNLINLGSVKKNVRGREKLVTTYYKPCRNLNDANDSSVLRAPTFVLLIATTVAQHLLRKTQRF